MQIKVKVQSNPMAVNGGNDFVVRPHDYESESEAVERALIRRARAAHGRLNFQGRNGTKGQYGYWLTRADGSVIAQGVVWF